MNLLNKIKKHLKQHTLIITLLNKFKKLLGLDLNRAKHDSYYIEKAQDYIAKRAKTEKWLKEQAIMQELLTEIPNSSTVLDVPFGTGRFVDLYLKKNMSVFGVDISKDMLVVAKKYLGDAYSYCNIKVGSAEHLHFEDNLFDLVVSCRFFTLIPLDLAKRVLSEFYRVSKSKIILNIRLKKGNISAPYWIKSKRISGNICEKELINIFKNFNFEVLKKKIILEDSNTTLLFFILKKMQQKVR